MQKSSVPGPSEGARLDLYAHNTPQCRSEREAEEWRRVRWEEGRMGSEGGWMASLGRGVTERRFESEMSAE